MDSEDGLNQPPSSDSFWEVDSFKKTVKRTEDGMAMCNELVKFMQERSEIEKDYSKHLKEFSKKWHGVFEKGPEYASNREMLLGMLNEADSLADVHTSIKDKLLNVAVIRIKEWRNENYKKSLVGGPKIAKQFEDEFKKAQKPWAKQLGKVNKYKKEYFNACKAERSLAQQESNARGSGDTPAEQLTKIQDKLEKSRMEMKTAKNKYEEGLKDLNYLTPRYMEDMAVVFRSTQDFEEKRLQFNKKIMRDLSGLLNLSQNEMVPIIYKQMSSTIDKSNPAEDLKWWAATHGVGMSMNWPVFEEYVPEMQSISRKNKGGLIAGGANGVALTSAASTYDSSSSSLAANGAEEPPQYSVAAANPPEYRPSTVSRASTMSAASGQRAAPAYDPFTAPAAAPPPAATPPPAAAPAVAAAAVPVAAAAARAQERPPAVSARNSSLSIQQQQPQGSNPFGEDFDDDEFDDDDDDGRAAATSGRHGGHVDHAPDDTYENIPHDDDKNPFGPCDDEADGEQYENLKDEPGSGSGGAGRGVPVQAMYDYKGVDEDELSFKAGDHFIKLKEEDEQGWCTGMLNGKVGLYPANFAKNS